MEKTKWWFLGAFVAVVAAMLVLLGCSSNDDDGGGGVSPTYTLSTNISPMVGGVVSRNPELTNYNEGTAVTITAAANPGFRFTGWSGASSLTNAEITLTMGSNLTLTANFVAVYTLTTDALPVAGGSVKRSLNQTNYDEGTEVTVTAEPNAGYKFIGWTGVPSGINASNAEITFGINSNLALVANFESIPTYTVTYNGNGNTGGTAPTDDYSPYLQNTTVTILGKGNLEKTNYNFNGWNTAADGSGTNYAPGDRFSITENITLFARWTLATIPTYTATISSAGIGASGSGEYEQGKTVEITAGTVEGQRFVNWTTTSAGVTFANANNAATSFTMPANAVTVTANFEPIPTYAVTVSSAGTGASGSGNYVQGATVEISAGTAPTGHLFVNWTTTSAGVILGDANNPTTSFIMPANAVTVTANYEVITYTVTWNTNGGSPVPTQISVNHGGSIAAPATITKTDYIFGGWYINADFSGTAVTFPITNVTANTVLHASWGEIPNAARRAEPVAAVPSNPDSIVILDSFENDGKNWYVIYAGHIRDLLFMEAGPDYYSGMGTYEFTETRTIETSIGESMTQSISESFIVSDAQTNTTSIDKTDAWSHAWNVSIGGGNEKFFWVEGGYSGSVENSVTRSSGTSRTIQNTRELATQISGTLETSLRESWSRSTTISYQTGREVEGYYRIAWYTVSDVFFIVSAISRDGIRNDSLHSIQVISYPRANPRRQMEFSPNDNFDNRPITGNEISFSEDFWRNLPMPDDSYRLTTNVNIAAGGNISRSPNASRYNAGTQVTLTATPSTNYEFVNWTGTGAPTGTAANNAIITVTMNSDLTLTANFRPQQRTLTISTAGSGSVSRSPNQVTYDHGTQVTLTAEPSDYKHKFANWTGAPAGINAENATITVTMNGDLTLTANFRAGTPRQVTETFTSNGSYHLTNFPAEVEIVAVGGGGGGQGGHDRDATPPFTSRLSGNGGAGGGGGTVRTTLVEQGATTFTITVGNGGEGGNGRQRSGVQEWEAGFGGSNGGETRVARGADNIVVAHGGQGGGHNRTAVSGNRGHDGGAGGGGTGGTVTQGGNGTNGVNNNNTTASTGGNSTLGHGGHRNAGTALASEAGIGGGGAGNWRDNRGLDGGRGEVRITITRWE